MHPHLSKRALFLHVLPAVLLAGLSLASTGCTSSESRGPSPFLPADTLRSVVDRDSALAVLTSMKRTAFDSAFAAADDYAFTRSVRTEQLSPSGTTTAVRSFVVRYAPRAEEKHGHLRTRDSTGTFRRGGLFGRAAPEQSPTSRPTDLAPQIFPEQPAYVEPRTRDAFTYALQADSLLDGTPVHVLDVTARRHGRGREQGVRYARLLIHRPSNELVGLEVVRDDQVLLFSEESRTSIRLRRASGDRGPWLPHVVRVRAYLNVPFRAPRQYRIVSAFYNYRR